MLLKTIQYPKVDNSWTSPRGTFDCYNFSSLSSADVSFISPPPRTCRRTAGSSSCWWRRASTSSRPTKTSSPSPRVTSSAWPARRTAAGGRGRSTGGPAGFPATTCARSKAPVGGRAAVYYCVSGWWAGLWFQISLIANTDVFLSWVADKQVSPKSGTLKSPPKGFDTSAISKTYYNLVSTWNLTFDLHYWAASFCIYCISACSPFKHLLLPFSERVVSFSTLVRLFILKMFWLK